MKIILICPRRIGDVFLSSSIISAIRRKYEEAQIHILVFQGTEMGVISNTKVDRILSIPEKWTLKEHFKFLLKNFHKYDLAISLLPGDRPTLYAGLFGRKRIGTVTDEKKYFWKRWLLNSWVTFNGDTKHTVAMYQKIVSSVVGNTIEGPEFFGNESSDSFKLDKWEYKDRFVVFHLTPKFRYKEWPLAQWHRLIELYLKRGIGGVVLMGIDDKFELPFKLAREIRILNLVNNATVDDLFETISRSHCYVGTDTAVTHMAASIGVPVIAIYGPSCPVVWGPWPKGYLGKDSPWKRVGSQRVGSVDLVQGETECVPCRNEGCDSHINSKSDCLVSLDATRVLDLLVEKAKGTIP